MLGNKSYKIYDDVFGISAQTRIFENLIHLNYFLGWSDREDKNNYRYLYSQLDVEWLNYLNFFQNIENKNLYGVLENKNFSPNKVVVNVSVPGYFYVPHSHQSSYALVYYANLEWDEHWAGETIIYNGAGKESNICIPYTPNRVLLLNKNIPHALRPPTFAAPFYRFSISMFFD